jgi:hypothetical protein
MTGSGLPTGEYHGFLTATGTQTSVATRIPYWFGVPGSTVQNISIQSLDPGPYCPGDMATIIIRSVDAIGLPLDAGVPQVSVTGVRSKVSVVSSGNIPGTYEVDVQIGRPDANGLNAVTVSTGGISQEIDLSVN